MQNTREKIKGLFLQMDDWTVVKLTHELQVSKQLIHRILKELVENGELIKLGFTPKTIYRKVFNGTSILAEKTTSYTDNDFLNKHFLLISETGEYLEGSRGFESWCKKRKLPLQKSINEFKVTREKYDIYYDNNGLVNGTQKLSNTKGYDAIYLDSLFYLDFYAIERFGKTKLGTILHYAKQAQNKFLMTILLGEIKLRIEKFINENEIEAIAFVPPTIKRELQLIQFIKNGLADSIPLISIKKINGIIPVPQKSLNSLEERINNADNSFAILETGHYNKILLLDDAVGSGATLNQISKKIKSRRIAEIVIGLAIVGSYKGFDVITDV